MNSNRLLRQNGLLVQQNNSLNTSLNMTVHRMRSVEHELHEHKIRLANALNNSGSKALEELLSNATERALSAEKQLQEHKVLLSNATERALSAEKQLELLAKKPPVENPPIHITRTRRT